MSMTISGYTRSKADRLERVTITMPKEELAAVDGWGVPAGMASRSATIRALVQRGLETVTRPGTGGQPAVGEAS